jgi:adenosylmethionine-8-amino-7-oxononanoate aminotransferase
MLRGVELVRDTEKLQPFPELGRALKRTALNNGLVMRVDPNWFAVAPALIAERGDIDELVDLIERSLLDALEQVGA